MQTRNSKLKTRTYLKNIPTRVASTFLASARLAKEAVLEVLRPRRNEAEREKRRNPSGDGQFSPGLRHSSSTHFQVQSRRHSLAGQKLAHRAGGSIFERGSKNLCGGFSLLETLVALAVLTTAITGPMSLATVSIRSASLAHNNTIASFLAEEGVEIARAIRDKNSYSGADWLAGLGACTAAAPCKADIYPTNSVTPCGGSSCPPLKYDGGTNGSGMYTYTLGTNSIFTRTVSIDTTAPFNNAREAQVTVTVSWKERFLPQTSSVTITTNISNWK